MEASLVMTGMRLGDGAPVLGKAPTPDLLCHHGLENATEAISPGAS